MFAEATDRLGEILSKSGLRIVANGEDRYGRTLARFMIGENSAGEMLVDEGLARPCGEIRRNGASEPCTSPDLN